MSTAGTASPKDGNEGNEVPAIEEELLYSEADSDISEIHKNCAEVS
jgi:hypothetical protein